MDSQVKIYFVKMRKLLHEVVKKFVAKIYAQPNGDCTIQLGVAHISSSGREIRTLDTTGMNRML